MTKLLRHASFLRATSIPKQWLELGDTSLTRFYTAVDAQVTLEDPYTKVPQAEVEPYSA
jgi:hypothetical protein